MQSLHFSILLPIIFALHNLEEYFYFENFTDNYFNLIGKKFKNRQVFLYAITLLTILVSGIAWLNYFFTSPLTKNLTVIILFSILINGMQHVFSSMLFKKILPGFFTAIFLIIPFCFYIIQHDFYILFTPRDLILYGIYSILASFVSIYLSLWVGFFLIKNLQLRGKIWVQYYRVAILRNLSMKLLPKI